MSAPSYICEYLIGAWMEHFLCPHKIVQPWIPIWLWLSQCPGKFVLPWATFFASNLQFRSPGFFSSLPPYAFEAKAFHSPKFRLLNLLYILVVSSWLVVWKTSLKLSAWRLFCFSMILSNIVFISRIDYCTEDSLTASARDELYFPHMKLAIISPFCIHPLLCLRLRVCQLSHSTIERTNIIPHHQHILLHSRPHLLHCCRHYFPLLMGIRQVGQICYELNFQSVQNKNYYTNLSETLSQIIKSLQDTLAQASKLSKL